LLCSQELDLLIHRYTHTGTQRCTYSVLVAGVDVNLPRTEFSLLEFLMRHTGQSLKKIEKDTDRDMFMTGKQAQEYGLVDDVIAARPEGSLKK